MADSACGDIDVAVCDARGGGDGFLGGGRGGGEGGELLSL